MHNAGGSLSRDSQNDNPEDTVRNMSNEDEAAALTRKVTALDYAGIVSRNREVFLLNYAADCTSSEPIGQVDIGIKRGSGPSELKFWLQDGAAGVDFRWFSV